MEEVIKYFIKELAYLSKNRPKTQNIGVRNK